MFKSRIDQLGSWMINDLSVSVYEINIPFISQSNAVQKQLKSCIIQMDQQNPLNRIRTLRNLHHPRHGDHPAVLITAALKNLLNLRKKKMLILCPIQRIGKPCFPCYIQIVSHTKSRYRFQQFPISRKKSDTICLIHIIFIKQVKPFTDGRV